MSESKRRHFAGTEKVQILKRHLVEKVPVSDLCDEFNLYPTQLYNWLKEFFENGHAAFLKLARTQLSVITPTELSNTSFVSRLMKYS
jgi:transposase-like protein